MPKKRNLGERQKAQLQIMKNNKEIKNPVKRYNANKKIKDNMPPKGKRRLDKPPQVVNQDKTKDKKTCQSTA